MAIASWIRLKHPDGNYIVLQYDTLFENKAAAVETVTLSQDSDGQWRVAGYFIK